MAQQAYLIDPSRNPEPVADRLRLRVNSGLSGLIFGQYDLLLILALAVDLLTPTLIFMGILPAPIRWISHIAIAIVIVAAFARMMVDDRVPRVVVPIAGISLIGITTALLEGQAIIPTLWGWWMMFRYPMVGLYVYLKSSWPDQFPQKLRQICVAILGLELVVQLAQYFAGEEPSDSLAGTFGEHGVGPLVTFILFVLCLAFGQWMAHGKWKTLVWVLAMGAVSSALGVMRIYLFAVVGLGVMALIISLARGGKLVRQIPVLVLFGGMILLSTDVYNSIVPGAQRRPFESILQWENLSQYLDSVEQGSGEGQYYGRSYLGRNAALRYGWDVIQRDATTLLFGMGLGARGESRVLGTAGHGLLQGPHGLTSGTSLLVMLQELGIVGQIAFAGFVLATAYYLYRETRKYPESDVNELLLALLLFTLFLPLWIWYKQVWIHRVTMLLYWASLGYVLAQARSRKGHQT